MIFLLRGDCHSFVIILLVPLEVIFFLVLFMIEVRSLPTFHVCGLRGKGVGLFGYFFLDFIYFLDENSVGWLLKI